MLAFPVARFVLQKDYLNVVYIFQKVHRTLIGTAMITMSNTGDRAHSSSSLTEPVSIVFAGRTSLSDSKELNP